MAESVAIGAERRADAAETGTGGMHRPSLPDRRLFALILDQLAIVADLEAERPPPAKVASLASLFALDSAHRTQLGERLDSRQQPLVAADIAAADIEGMELDAAIVERLDDRERLDGAAGDIRQPGANDGVTAPQLADQRSAGRPLVPVSRGVFLGEGLHLRAKLRGVALGVAPASRFPGVVV